MKNAGHFERYVVTQRKDGTFLMDKKVGYNHYEKDQIEKLLVCNSSDSFTQRLPRCTKLLITVRGFNQTQVETKVARN